MELFFDLVEDLPGGLDGPLVLAICYVVVRLIHIALYWYTARGNARLRRQLTLNLIPMFAGSVPLFVAAAVHDERWRTALWATAIVANYGLVLLTGVSGWRIHSAEHWAERHGLIVIVALGESFVSIGVGVAALPVAWPIIVATTFGFAVGAALWWTYFDVTALQAE